LAPATARSFTVSICKQARIGTDAIFIACAALRDKFVTSPDFDGLVSPVRKQIKLLNLLINADMKKGDTV
jgi:hypothetical protein